MFNLDDSLNPKIHRLQTAQCLFQKSSPPRLQCQATYGHFIRRGVLNDLGTEVGAMNGASVLVQGSGASHATLEGVFFREAFVNCKGLKHLENGDVMGF